MFSRLGQPAWLLPLLLLLSACSSQFVYERIDWFTKYQIEKYVDLNKEQEMFVKASMDSVLSWHRQDELTKYIDFLDGITQALDQEVTAEQVKVWIAEVRSAYDSLLVMMSPWLIELAASLKPEQIEELMKNMQEQNRELEDKYLSRDAKTYVNSLDKRYQKSFKYWLGRLTNKQKTRIGDTMAELERLDEQWMHERKRWQQQLISVLDKKQGWRNELAVLLHDGTDYSKAAAEEASQRNMQRISQLLADVINMRSEKQNRKLIKNIDKWKNDIISIRDRGMEIRKVASQQ